MSIFNTQGTHISDQTTIPSDFPFHLCSLRASLRPNRRPQGSDCKVRTQEAENFDEEDKSLVSAWSCPEVCVHCIGVD